MAQSNWIIIQHRAKLNETKKAYENNPLKKKNTDLKHTW